MSPYIEIHHNGQWHRAAKLHVHGEDRIRVDYDTGYLFSLESQPISLGLPLNMDPYAGAADDLQGLAPPDPTPAFLFDLVPQGRGREFLLGLLGMRSDSTQIVPLIMNGAFNPIGRLRVTTAMDFYRAQVEKDSTRDYLDGFTLKDIATKSEDFLDHLSVHAMLAAGTTGVQGVAPKFLLNQDAQGRWFADMALPDEAVESHWLVKRPRGRNPEDRTVLRNEAPTCAWPSAWGFAPTANPLCMATCSSCSALTESLRLRVSCDSIKSHWPALPGSKALPCPPITTR